MIIAGVMSGSSLDGLDIAIVEFGGSNQWQLKWTKGVSYSGEWVAKLKNYRQLSATEYIKMTSAYGVYIGSLLKEAFIEYKGTIDFVSFHGHTLAHIPKDKVTIQIGNGGALAAITNIPTITDFRIQDVVKGGEGTPLAPLVELHLFSGHTYYLNLGGIANITKIESGRVLAAYDVCPFNQVLNHFSKQLGFEFDEDGRLARSGDYQEALVHYLEGVGYFKQQPPKSLDNNWIVEQFIPQFPELTPIDTLATYTQWTASCIAKEIADSDFPTSMMISGGGSHNDYFIQYLSEALQTKNCKIAKPSDEMIDYKEAILMALLARNYLNDEVNVLSAVTGASSDSIGGALYKVCSVIYE